MTEDATERKPATVASESSNLESSTSPATGEDKEVATNQGNVNNPVVATGRSASLDPADDIVLGPGGQWGLPLERQPLREQLRNTDCITPKVAAWSLPTVQQPWEFSEITHHGRRKHRAQNRKKRMED